MRSATAFTLRRCLTPLLLKGSFAFLLSSVVPLGAQSRHVLIFLVQYTSTIVHVAIYHNKEIKNGLKAVWHRHSVRLPFAAEREFKRSSLLTDLSPGTPTRTFTTS